MTSPRSRQNTKPNRQFWGFVTEVCLDSTKHYRSFMKLLSCYSQTSFPEDTLSPLTLRMSSAVLKLVSIPQMSNEWWNQQLNSKLYYAKSSLRHSQIHKFTDLKPVQIMFYFLISLYLKYVSEISECLINV